MKKKLGIIALVVLMVCTLTACAGISKADYVGQWESVTEKVEEIDGFDLAFDVVLTLEIKDDDTFSMVTTTEIDNDECVRYVDEVFDVKLAEAMEGTDLTKDEVIKAIEDEQGMTFEEFKQLQVDVLKDSVGGNTLSGKYVFVGNVLTISDDDDVSALQLNSEKTELKSLAENEDYTFTKK